MKDMKTQFDQYKSLICLLVGVVFVIVSYLYGIQAYNEKKSDTEAEVEVLQGQYDHLKQMYDNKQTYVDQTATYKSDYDKLLAKYDADVAYTSVIMDEYNIEQKTKVLASSLGFEEFSVPYAFGTMTSSNPDNAVPIGNNEGFVAKAAKYSLTYVGNYDEVKAAITELLNVNGKRIVPTDVSFAFVASNGEVTATMNVNEYAVMGGERTAKAVTIPTVKRSVKNIFYDGFIGTGNATK